MVRSNFVYSCYETMVDIKMNRADSAGISGVSCYSNSTTLVTVSHRRAQEQFSLELFPPLMMTSAILLFQYILYRELNFTAIYEAQ